MFDKDKLTLNKKNIAVNLNILKSFLILKNEYKSFRSNNFNPIKLIYNVKVFLQRLNRFISQLNFYTKETWNECMVLEAFFKSEMKNSCENKDNLKDLTSNLVSVLDDFFINLSFLETVDLSVDNLFDLESVDLKNIISNSMNLDLEHKIFNFKTDIVNLNIADKSYVFGKSLFCFYDWEGYFDSHIFMTEKDYIEFSPIFRIEYFKTSSEKKYVNICGFSNENEGLFDYTLINPKIEIYFAQKM